ncbi:hypothetical protein NN561_005407 [Cricetulus griseus]
MRPRPLPCRPSDWCVLPPVSREGVASSRPLGESPERWSAPGVGELAHWIGKAWEQLIRTRGHRSREQRGESQAGLGPGKIAPCPQRPPTAGW